MMFQDPTGASGPSGPAPSGAEEIAPDGIEGLSSVIEQPDKVVEYVKTAGADLGLNLLAAVAILFFGWIAAKIVTSILRRVLKKSKVEETIISFVANLGYMIMLVFVILAAIGKLGVQTTSLIAIIGAAGLAVAFALQGALGNFASGVMLIMFRPFKVGDFVEAAGIMGVVKEVQVFATTFTTPDNKKIIVPNGSITADNIINWSANDTRRVDLVFGIGYGDDMKKAKEIMEEVLKKEPLVLDDPAPKIAVLELGDSSVNFAVRPWVKTRDYWDAYFELNETIKREFDAQGINIPFPQRDIHVHQVA